VQRRFAAIVRGLAVVTLLVSFLSSRSLAQNKHVFVTSETTDGSIQEPPPPAPPTLTGIAAANAICTRLAQASTTLPAAAKADTWLAWLSTDGTASGSPQFKFNQATIPYRLPDLTTIVDNNWTQLTNGNLDAPINQDENATPIPSQDLRFPDIARI
jgi:hypothetical protein